MLTQLQADIESARAKLEAARRNYLLDLQKLWEIEEQICNCTIFATRPGQVVYANERDYRGGTTVVIEPGTIIRERQVIIRLPDPSQMRVVARINESRVNLVQRGMRAKILLDAFLNHEITGVVEEVSDYPAPTSFWLQNVKEYEAKVRIENPPPGLRPGFTAQVQIRVAEVPEVLQVPVQAVLEHGGKYYCISGPRAGATGSTSGPAGADQPELCDRGRGASGRGSGGAKSAGVPRESQLAESDGRNFRGKCGEVAAPKAPPEPIGAQPSGAEGPAEVSLPAKGKRQVRSPVVWRRINRPPESGGRRRRQTPWPGRSAGRSAA